MVRSVWPAISVKLNSSFFHQSIDLKVGDINIKSSETMKILGVIMNKSLTLIAHVEKIIQSCKKLTLRYLQNSVSTEVLKDVVRAQVVSKISYISLAWSHRISFSLRVKLRSAYYKILRNVVRDLDFKLNRKSLLISTGQESIEVIFEKRTSQFLFKLITFISPSNLETTWLSECYFNERNSDRLSFFDTSWTRFSKACITNAAKRRTENWKFGWLSQIPAIFKHSLSTQLKNLLEWTPAQFLYLFCRRKGPKFKSKRRCRSEQIRGFFRPVESYPEQADWATFFEVQRNPGLILQKHKGFCEKSPGTIFGYFSTFLNYYWLKYYPINAFNS